MEVRNVPDKGVCIASFDGGGPGSISQLLIMNEIMKGVEYDLDLEEGHQICPADYWDLMGGVGLGGLCALLLGRLRMSVEEALEELITIARAVFAKDASEITTPEANTAILKNAIESLLERHRFPIDIKLNDKALRVSNCKVVVFASTTSTRDHPHLFRTYSTRHADRKCTFVEAACAILAIPQFFSPFVISDRFIKQAFTGNPLGFNNPTRQVLEEALSEFGDKRKVSLVLSLGSGRPAVLSRVIHPDGIRNLLTCVVLDCERVARELSAQFIDVKAYLRLSVDRGMENIAMSDWDESGLGSITTHTEVYLQASTVKNSIAKFSKILHLGPGIVSLGQLNRAGTEFISGRLQQRGHRSALSPAGIKQMSDIVRDVMHGITLVDAIGNRVQIPMEWCYKYTMLEDMIRLYFKHQKPPGAALVEQGDYRLVHGSRGDILRPARWTYDLKAGSVVEMSMVLRKRNELHVACPSCRTKFEGRAKNGWADWKVS